MPGLPSRGKRDDRRPWLGAARQAVALASSVLIQFARNTPLYVQLIWVAYVWPDIFGWPVRFFDAGWTALALQSAGYLAETFRAGIEGVPAGHRHAAQALGMGPVLTMRRIVLPQTFLTMCPRS
jgi:polar amino acid transport system permease protein